MEDAVFMWCYRCGEFTQFTKDGCLKCLERDKEKNK